MIKPLSTFYTLVLDAVLIVGTVGYIAPFLISLPDTISVVAGFGLLILVLPTLLYFINKPLVTKIINLVKDSN